MADEIIGALSSRDVSALTSESRHLDAYATRGFEDFLVVLPTEPDFPFEISHTLTPALPTGIRYELLQSTYPTVLYHDTVSDLWGVDYIVLRATSGDGAQVRIRLTVDDGDDSAIVGIADREYARGFQVTGPLGSLGTRGVAASAWSAGFSYTLNASHWGPSVDLGDASVGWNISSNTLDTGRHALRFIAKGEGGTYRYAMQLTQGGSPTAGVYYLTKSAPGELHLGGPSALFGPGYELSSVHCSGPVNGWAFSGDTFQFPATQVASADANTLDDYEEGSWTPTLAFGGASVGITYSTRTGTYTKVGNTVTVELRIVLTSKGSSTGSSSITGLPFTTSLNPSALFDCASGGPGVLTYGALSGTSVFPLMAPRTLLTDTNFTGTDDIRFGITYRV